MSLFIEHAPKIQDKSATKYMIEKNLRYFSNLSGYAWDKIWNSPEGRESIEHAFSEAIYHVATLPEMGSVVPFGTTAEFIPAVECFVFALTTGKNRPFIEIDMYPVHENDQHNNYQKDDNFVFELIRGIPRGDCLAVVTEGIKIETNKKIGDIYDESFLMELAKRHSPSYRQYIIDKEDFQRMRIEGKLKKDTTGREYLEKKINKKDGGVWDKKIYEHDLINPYDGPDKIKMLVKLAGKHFFKKYMKVRNAAAMADEWNGDDIEDEITRNQAADNVLSSAQKQFNTDASDIKDAEIVTDDDPASENKKGGDEKKDLKNNKEGLFNEDEIKNL